MGYKYVSYKKCAGFPASAYQKVTQKLENEKISYITYEKEKAISEYKGIAKNYNLILKKL